LVRARQVGVLAEDAEGEALGTYYIRPNAGGGGAHVCNCGYITADAARGRAWRAPCWPIRWTEARRQGYRAMQFNFVVATNAVRSRRGSVPGSATWGGFRALSGIPPMASWMRW
jgi:hypothetical protein